VSNANQAASSALKRADRILRHPLFLEHMEQNRKAEENRIYCHHDLPHLLDTARIMRIISLEENIEIPADLIYAAALVHDLGKHLQYDRGIPHEQAGADIASAILEDCGFSVSEIAVVVDAVRGHRDPEISGQAGLSALLYRADKASRSCWCCPAAPSCNWSDEKKNLHLVY
jgi:uncharacterized protein